MKKKILIVVHTNTWFTEMNRVTDLVANSDRFVPHVHFAYAYPTADRDIQTLKIKGVVFSTSWSNELPAVSYKFIAKVFRVGNYYLERIFKLRKIGRYLNHLNPFTAPFSMVASCFKDISYYKKLILELDACVIVMGGDLVGYNTPEIVRAASKAKRACVIVPSTMSDGIEQAEAYLFEPNYSIEKFSNRLAGWIWPKWKRFHKGKWLVRVPAKQIFARELLKTDPPLPWISSSTRADAIAVESKAMRDYYIRCGIDPKSLRETGSLANDSMAAVLKNKDILKLKLLQDLQLNPEMKIILTALPPDALYLKGERLRCEFKTYEELTKFWVQSLASAHNFNVVISLHPSVDIEDYRYLESANVRISKQTIVELIPLCDVFVASVSSTIRWAITCGKPVINYDVYLYRYVDFTAVKGVILLETSQEYSDIIAKVNDDTTGYLQYLNQEIESQAAYWGNLDGLEGKRILDLFEEEMNKKI